MVPEYKQSSLCTLHTRCTAGVPTADGADLHFPHPSLSQGRVRGLGRPAAGTGTKTDTSHKTGRTDKPDRTCTLSRNLSGTAPRTGRRFPTGRASYWEKHIGVKSLAFLGISLRREELKQLRSFLLFNFHNLTALLL